jgi:hypothetical protein
MTDWDAVREEVRSDAADWVQHAAEVLRRIARDATPGPWRWGDPAATVGMLERQRTTLERSPMNTAFPAIRRRADDGEPVLPGLRDPLDPFEDAVDAISPRPSQSHSASLLDALAEQIGDAGGSVVRGSTCPRSSAQEMGDRSVRAKVCDGSRRAWAHARHASVLDPGFSAG